MANKSASNRKNTRNPASRLYRQLTKLLSGPVSIYNRESEKRLKRNQYSHHASKFKSAAGKSFKRNDYTPYNQMTADYMANQNRADRYVDFDQMEYCLHGDTKIAVPGGYKTLRELSEEYGVEKEFIVYSYDHAKGEIVPALGKQARKTTTDHAWKVVFENGQEIIGTANHRLMLRDGTYRRIDELAVGNSMMPFYRKDLVGDGKQWIYTMQQDESKHSGWMSESLLLVEWIQNEFREDKNTLLYENLNKREDITFEKILAFCDINGFDQKKICSAFDISPDLLDEKLRTKSFKHFEAFVHSYSSSLGKSVEYKERLDSATNHKVAKIEYYGFIDLYDLTVDGYKNFATDTVISHNTPELASALDIYADEMTTSNELNSMLNIKTSNEEIKNALYTLFYKVLNIEFNMFGWARSMCKYGDHFLYLDIDEGVGIKHAIGLPQNEIERLEGEDRKNPKYVQYQWNATGMTFENWQIAHFRILGNDRYAPYGTSVLEAARRIWRQLTLMEDAVMAYRIVRSPERRVFYVDIGNIPPQDVEQYMQKVISQMKRNQIIDQSTGRVDLRYNPMSVEEDYFIPVRGQSSNTRIENLPGGTYTGDIDDIKYLRDKLFSALKIPASYLSNGEEAGEDKTTLAQKDIRFARTIQRLQKSVVSELEKIAIIHLFTLGYRGRDLINFKLTLNNPSKLAELQELEHWRTKFDVASAATEGYFSRRWVFEHVFNVSEKEMLRIQRERFFDKKLDLALEQSIKAEEAAYGTDISSNTEMEGGEFALDGFDEPPGEMPGEGGEEGGAEEPTLLAQPEGELSEASPGIGKEYSRPKWKGKTHKKKSRPKMSVARKKSLAADVIPLERAGKRKTERGVWTGSEINSIIKSSVSENLSREKDSNYNEEEHILNSAFELGRLLESLEIKNNEN